ncbi:MAG: L-seryl-tRNA(Sec) selenium transferase [Desulfobacterales bacterium]|jgi:L-seryl-tRNA(Ser) seleniumtransferase
MDDQTQMLLQRLPGVDRLLDCARQSDTLRQAPHSVLRNAARTALEALRHQLLKGRNGLSAADVDEKAVLQRIETLVATAMQPNLRPTVNATGIVIHTNLGRSLLCPDAIANLSLIASRYSNLEYNLAEGSRGSRYSIVEDLLCEITGAEAGLVVNNNAGAVLLALETMAKSREVVVSRGELVEIGGAFRIPDVMSKSGAHLKEVGTTNRTHLRDYAHAIGEKTALLLKVHQSNFAITGFTKEVSLKELVALGQQHEVPVMEDLGSGTFVDFRRYGLPREPTVQESVASGVDMVTFSGDKLLGGPQAGLIVGKRKILDAIKQNPINRTMRIDKLTLAALESTLRLYRDEARAVAEIPTLRMMMVPDQVLAERAGHLCNRLQAIADPRLTFACERVTSRIGGGSLPLLKLPSHGVVVTFEAGSAQRTEAFLRHFAPPIIGRIEKDRFIMDVRTLQDNDQTHIETAFRHMLNKERL